MIIIIIDKNIIYFLFVIMVEKNDISLPDPLNDRVLTEA